MIRRRIRGARAAVVALSVLLACSPEAPDRSAEAERTAEATSGARRPDLVLVVLDTLRADHLSCYGYARETSPNLDRLCAESTVYESTHSSSSWTLPSHASIFTGLNPIRHGAHHEHRMLADEIDSLAEILSGAGYETTAIVSNAMLAKDRKLDQGFARYLETWRKKFDRHPKLFPDFETRRPMPWDGVEDPLFRAGMQQLRPGVDENSYFAFLRTLGERDPSKPAFVFVNLVGIHSPYNSSGPFYETFLRHPELTLDENSWPEYYAGRVHPPAEQFEHFVDLYDAEILHADFIVGKMIEAMKKAGIWEDALFVVTSDHGENLGDHGHLSHVFSLHETLTRVPLIVHQPSRFPAGTRVETPALLVDLFPTFLAAAGIDPADHPSDGVALPIEAARSRSIIAEYYYPWENIRFLMRLYDGDVPGIERWERRLRSITDGDMKLIWGSDGVHELYDLRRDPGEDRNLIADPEHAAAREALLRGLSRYVEENGGPTPIPKWTPEADDREGAPGLDENQLDPETVRQLKELGYL